MFGGCEYLAAKFWPLSTGWFPVQTREVKFYCLEYEIVCPIFGLRRPNGKSNETIIAELEHEAMQLLGPWNKKEYDSFVVVCCHRGQVNRFLHEMRVRYES